MKVCLNSNICTSQTIQQRRTTLALNSSPSRTHSYQTTIAPVGCVYMVVFNLKLKTANHVCQPHMGSYAKFVAEYHYVHTGNGCTSHSVLTAWLNTRNCMTTTSSLFVFYDIQLPEQALHNGQV